MRKTKQRRSVDAWRELVARQAQSGLSVAAFCQRESISPCSLYSWRKRLRPVDGTDVRGATVSVVQEPAPEFIDLGPLGERSESSRCEIRLDLGGGVVLHLVRS
jgi:transposase-like protein